MRSFPASIRAGLITLSLATAFAAAAAEVPVPPGQNPDLTVYSGDFGLVREHRTARLTDGETRLAFTGVSRNLQPETASLQIAANEKVKATEVRILDQTFAFNLMSPQALLEQAVGKEVSIVTTNPATGRDSTERAKVISVQNGVILDIGGKIYTGAPGRIVFDSLPGDLRAVPTLLVTAAGPAGVDIPVELSYLTGGLGWHADYVANYDTEGSRLDLTGWATITNTTGVDFKNAKLKLVAGDVNRATPPPMRPLPRLGKVEMAAAAQPAASAQDVAPQSFAGLNLYTIPRPVTLSTGETMQLALLHAVNLPVKRDTMVRGQPWFYTSSMAGQRQESRAEIEVTFKNEGRARAAKGKAPEPADVASLGAPLPAGVVRAYGEDSDGSPQFLGEDHVDHIAEGGEVRLHLGRDVEVPVVREQISYVHASETISLSVWRITVRNTKAKPLAVRVSEPIPGNWEITRETVAHTKDEAGAAEWTLNLPAKGQVVLEYTVKTTL